MAVPLERKRNIGIIAHIDAGKTTTTERILYYTGAEHRLGNVDDGTTVTDWMEEERKRGITITAAAVTCPWRDCEINLIDTPGHVDFTAEVERSLRVLDGAIVVLDAVAGVQAQSETVWRQADHYRVPRLVFVNKMDRPGADFEKCLAMIRSRLGATPLAIQMPLGAGQDFVGAVDLLRMVARTYEPGTDGSRYTDGPVPPEAHDLAQLHREEMVHLLAEHSDALMEKYLEDQPIGEDDLRAAIREATLAGRLVPVLCGSALRNTGIQRLLDAVCDYLPSPLDVPPVRGVHPKTEQPIERQASEKGHFLALVFKIASDEHGDLFYLRLYAGRLTARQQVFNPRTEARERVTTLFRMYANARTAIDEAVAGDIVAVSGLRNSSTGDTLCDPRHVVVLERMSFPDTVISMAIEPKTSAERARLDSVLARLEREDPTFRRRVDPETGQTIVSGMGELHLEVLKHRMLSDFHVAANVGKPRVSYKETIAQAAEAEADYVQPMGSRPQFARVKVRLEPEPALPSVEVWLQASEDEIPRAFHAAVKDGIESSASSGVFAGYPMVGVRAKVVGGSAHATDSTEGAFAAAAARAFRLAAEQAGMVLLEPWMRFEVITPEAHLGDVLADLNARRAQIAEQQLQAGVHVIAGKVPLSEMFGYATALRSLTQGRAMFTMEPVAYLPVPDDVARKMML
ncbi:MAG TPA: elongation factor G [Planctomycetota bacterium]|nr:elongation factor G [Planctomycetota bacterium]HRR81413.1 elongation factor G [Planctomycetota bacterium]HRT94748.1 elongation factor G [Planctomycetota bacterium]